MGCETFFLYFLYFLLFIFILLVYFVLCFAEINALYVHVRVSFFSQVPNVASSIACNVPFCVSFPPFILFSQIFVCPFSFFFSLCFFVKWRWHMFVHRVCLIARICWKIMGVFQTFLGLVGAFLDVFFFSFLLETNSCSQGVNNAKQILYRVQKA